MSDKKIVVPMDKRGLEQRVFKLDEIRMVGGDDPRIEGYAAVFDQPSQDLGGFVEYVRQGAFKKTVQEADIRALFNHDSNYVIGRNRSGTLTLAEDSKGLEIVARPPDTGWARDLQVSMERGDIDQMSFGFQTVRDEWRYEQDPSERDLLEVRLFDVSVVTYPAYTQTTVQVRTLEQMVNDFEGEPDEVRDLIAKLLAKIPARPGLEPHRLDVRQRRLQLEQLI